MMRLLLGPALLTIAISALWAQQSDVDSYLGVQKAKTVVAGCRKSF
jgi:hypothetical protein